MVESQAVEGVILRIEQLLSKEADEQKKHPVIKDIFSIIIDIVDKNVAMQKSAPVTPLLSSASVADELTKLAKLKESGILSEEEFQAQKAKLLGL